MVFTRCLSQDSIQPEEFSTNMEPCSTLRSSTATTTHFSEGFRQSVTKFT